MKVPQPIIVYDLVKFKCPFRESRLKRRKDIIDVTLQYQKASVPAENVRWAIVNICPILVGDLIDVWTDTDQNNETSYWTKLAFFDDIVSIHIDKATFYKYGCLEPNTEVSLYLDKVCYKGPKKRLFIRWTDADNKRRRQIND